MDISNTPNLKGQDIKLLNSRKALKIMLQAEGPVDFARVTRMVKFERNLEKLQVELIKLQKWVMEKEKGICILFEGRDAAGKGGCIRRITHHLNPRVYKAIALPKPTETEKKKWYFQRYIAHLPEPGMITFFDRSWYNRAIVEPVNGFCTKKEYRIFMSEINHFERMLKNSGIILIKFYLSISKQEQAKRFEGLEKDPLKQWKMTPVDRRAQELWDNYTLYKEKMFSKSNTKSNPWIVIEGNRKTRAREEAIRHILNLVPYSE